MVAGNLPLRIRHETCYLPRVILLRPDSHGRHSCSVTGAGVRESGHVRECGYGVRAANGDIGDMSVLGATRVLAGCRGRGLVGILWMAVGLGLPPVLPIVGLRHCVDMQQTVQGETYLDNRCRGRLQRHDSAAVSFQCD